MFASDSGSPKIGHFSFLNDQEEGMRNQLNCMVISGDLPMTVTWLKDGQHLQHDPDRTVKQISEFSSVGPQSWSLVQPHVCVAQYSNTFVLFGDSAWLCSSVRPHGCIARYLRTDIRPNLKLKVFDVINLNSNRLFYENRFLIFFNLLLYPCVKELALH